MLVRCRRVTNETPSGDDGLVHKMETALAHAGAGKRRNGLRLSAMARRRTTLGDYALPCIILTPRTPCAGNLWCSTRAVFCRGRPPDFPLHAGIDGAGVRTRHRRRDAGAHSRHAALRHDPGRADRLSHPEVEGGGELNIFWNERGAEWHRLGGAGGGNENAKPFLAKAAAYYLRVLRAIAPKAARVTDKMPFNFLWPG